MKNNLFLNPFAIISDKKQTLIGMSTFILGIIIAYFMHVNIQILRIDPVNKVSFVKAILNSFIVVFFLTFAFFGLGKVINKKTRLIDILNVVLISLIPIYLSLFQNINGYLTNEINQIMDKLKDGSINEYATPLFFFIITIISLLLFIYFIYLLFVGFKTATNAKKAWHYVAFFAVLIFIDVLTSALINLI